MIALATIAYRRPELIKHQIRLLDKHLADEYTLTVVDNTDQRETAAELRAVCVEKDVRYVHTHLPVPEHHLALNIAWTDVLEPSDAPYVGFLDHDVYPRRETTLIDKIDRAGFYGVGQRHAPTDRLYLWPGFCFFSRDFLAGRDLDFTGIRGREKKDDGDTGSGLWPLFEHVEWELMYVPKHGYTAIRRPDEYGLQSWGVEEIGDWVHFTNGSNWMAIPNPWERERLLLDLLETL